MRPKLNILGDELVNRIIAEGFELLMDPGVRVHNEDALKLLAEAGADVDMETQIAYIPEPIARRALETAPSEFYLYNLDGEPTVHYGGSDVLRIGGIGEGGVGVVNRLHVDRVHVHDDDVGFLTHLE